MNAKLLLLAALAACLLVASVASASPLADDGVFHSQKLAARHDHESGEHDGPLLHHSFVAPLNHYDNSDPSTFIYVSVHVTLRADFQ